jgi:phenol 2-monooxygenase
VIEEIIKKHIKSKAPLKVEYETVPTALQINENEVNDINGHPCVITLRHRDPDTEPKVNNNGSEEIVRAKYVIGADGGKSWTRKQLGFTMEGNRTQSIWGVIDLVVTSDFPE